MVYPQNYFNCSTLVYPLISLIPLNQVLTAPKSGYFS
jgi:hypothetical protein